MSVNATQTAALNCVHTTDCWRIYVTFCFYLHHKRLLRRSLTHPVYRFLRHLAVDALHNSKPRFHFLFWWKETQSIRTRTFGLICVLPMEKSTRTCSQWWVTAGHSRSGCLFCFGRCSEREAMKVHICNWDHENLRQALMKVLVSLWESKVPAVKSRPRWLPDTRPGLEPNQFRLWTVNMSKRTAESEWGLRSHL